MYSTIVVGTDGSQTAAGAVSVAADIALRTGAALHLVKAYQQGPSAVAMPIAGFSASDGDAEDAALAEAAEEDLASASQGLGGIKVERHVAGGPPAEVIVSVAEVVHADLIVVGNRGMNRRVLGSVPNSIAHHAPCTVLIVKTT